MCGHHLNKAEWSSAFPQEIFSFHSVVSFSNRVYLGQEGTTSAKYTEKCWKGRLIQPKSGFIPETTFIVLCIYLVFILFPRNFVHAFFFHKTANCAISNYIFAILSMYFVSGILGVWTMCVRVCLLRTFWRYWGQYTYDTKKIHTNKFKSNIKLRHEIPILREELPLML